MQIKIDNEIILEISDTEERIVKDSVPCYRSWIKAGIVNIIKAKIDSSMDKMDKEWTPKLIANGVVSVPTNREERAELIFNQPNYKSRQERDLENQL